MVTARCKRTVKRAVDGQAPLQRASTSIGGLASCDPAASCVCVPSSIALTMMMERKQQKGAGVMPVRTFGVYGSK